MKYFKPKGNRIKRYGWFGVMISFDDPNHLNYSWIYEDDSLKKGHWGEYQKSYPFGWTSISTNEQIVCLIK